jgi:hypothetical protein
MWHDYQNQPPDYDQDIIVILAGGEGIFRGHRERHQNQDWINANKYGMFAAHLVHWWIPAPALWPNR